MCTSSGQDPPPTKFDFGEFLKMEGLEIRMGQSTLSSSESEESSMSSESMHCPPHPCRCAVGVHCPAHPCTCWQCKKRGHEAMRCLWRTFHRHYRSLQSTKDQRREYLRLWRKMKNDDNTLKKAPDFLYLAAQKRMLRMKSVGTAAARLRCPRSRVALSKERSLFKSLTILNLSNSRTFCNRELCQIREDGLVPTLGKGCLGLFVPSDASYLTVDQLLCLQGLSPKKNKLVYDWAKDEGSVDMEFMLANSMTLSVVGPLLMVTLGMLRP